jgi:hypothetical protein
MGGSSGIVLSIDASFFAFGTLLQLAYSNVGRSGQVIGARSNGQIA